MKIDQKMMLAEIGLNVFTKILSSWFCSLIGYRETQRSKRKALHLSLQSFAKNKLIAYFCLNLPKSPTAEKVELQQMYLALDIKQNVLLNPLGNEFINNDELKLLYDAFDVR